LRFNGHEEFVHMRDDGILVSVEYKGDFQTNNQTYDNYRLIYRKYKLVDQPVLIDSCVADFKLWDGFPFLDGGDAVQFVDALDKVMINWRLNSRSRLVWDLAGNSDSIHVFSFSSFLTHPAAAFIAESGNSLGLVPSSNGSTIALFSLNSVDLLYSFYSPFNGEFYDNPIVTDKRITGIIASDHTYFKGDIDSNGKTDIFDLIEMLKRLKDKSLPYDRHYDLNNDNKVNIFDFLEMLRIISR
jgi:hypothetical protein